MKAQYLKSILFVDMETGLDNQYYTVDDVICNNEIRKVLIRVISKKPFTDSQKNVILLRFGFEGEPCTLADIGRKYNITRGRVREIEQTGLRKLRNPIHSKLYRCK